MNEPTMETLARRLDRENRRLKQAGVVALALIVGPKAQFRAQPPAAPLPSAAR